VTLGTVGLGVTALLACVTLFLFDKTVPRCPECGSYSVSMLRGLPLRVCEQCQAVWRM
jgi:hypothetical protein